MYINRAFSCKYCKKWDYKLWKTDKQCKTNTTESHKTLFGFCVRESNIKNAYSPTFRLYELPEGLATEVYQVVIFYSSWFLGTREVMVYICRGYFLCLSTGKVLRHHWNLQINGVWMTSRHRGLTAPCLCPVMWSPLSPPLIPLNSLIPLSRILQFLSSQTE